MVNKESVSESESETYLSTLRVITGQLYFTELINCNMLVNVIYYVHVCEQAR